MCFCSVAQRAEMRMLGLPQRVVAFILTVYIDIFCHKHYRMNTKMLSIDTPNDLTTHHL